LVACGQFRLPLLRQVHLTMLEEIKDGQEAAIGAVRSFVGNVDKTLAGSASPSQVEEIVDSALKMAARPVRIPEEGRAQRRRVGWERRRR
jgi:hypothetical protein